MTPTTKGTRGDGEGVHRVLISLEVDQYGLDSWDAANRIAHNLRTAIGTTAVKRTHHEPGPVSYGNNHGRKAHDNSEPKFATKVIAYRVLAYEDFTPAEDPA